MSSKKYSCSICSQTDAVVRQCKRGSSIKFFCKRCHKYFSVRTNYLDTKTILNDHLNGLSFRKLAERHNISKSKAARICHEQLQKLPDNNQFSFNYCNKYSAVFLFDGKYINVKGYDTKIAFLWGVDYFHHDFPIISLAPSESYQSWSRYFTYFRIINHRPQLLVCDDNTALKMAARHSFPKIRIQTCYNHFKENIRRELHIRSDPTYRYFSRSIDAILSHKQPREVFDKRLYNLFEHYKTDQIAVDVLTNIEKYKEELLAYKWITKSPLTTNLIECFNSHLEARLKPLKSFNSYKHAKLWLNGYVLKRRFTKFTDCTGKFKHLNGKMPIELTKKKDILLPTFF